MANNRIKTQDTISTQVNYRLVEALSEYDSRFKNLIEQLNEIVFTVNPEGQFTFLNPAWEIYTGFLVNESVGQPIQRFIYNDDLSLCIREFLSVKKQTRLEIRFVDKLGKILWFEANVKSIWEKKKLKEIFGTLVDISARKKLIDSEMLFNSLVASTSEIIFQIDRSAHIHFLTPAWYKITGHAITESLGQSLLQYIHEDDRHFAVNFIYDPQITVPSEPHQDFRVITKTGEIRWVTINIHEGDTKTTQIGQITGSMQDVTERVRVQQELKANKNRFSLAASAANDGIWDWNLLTDEVYFSPRWKEMLGYTDAELENSYATWHNLIHPDDLKETISSLMNCLEGQVDLFENVHRLKNKDGSWSWILDRGIVMRDEAGNPLRMAGSHADITRLRQIEEALLNQQQELSVLFSMSPDGIVTLSPEHIISSVNATFLSMTGFSSDELLYLTENEFIEKLNSICVSGTVCFFDENDPPSLLQILINDIKRIDTDSYVSPSISPNMLTLRTTVCLLNIESIEKVIYFRDVTAETEVDRMKSEFLSTAAHELRTPMASVYGFTELLLNREFEKGMTRDILGNIHQQAASLVRMINDLLDLAKIEARLGKEFHFLYQPLEPILRQSISEFMIHGDNREINTTFADIKGTVYVDADQIKRVFTNVIGNAFKYSPNNENIHITMTRRTNSLGNAQIGVIIKDKGFGMTDEQIEHIFERFWRGPNTTHINGTGLGMSLVKEIMNFHQADIDIHSQPNEGTTVGLWFKLFNESEGTYCES